MLPCHCLRPAQDRGQLRMDQSGGCATRFWLLCGALGYVLEPHHQSRAERRDPGLQPAPTAPMSPAPSSDSGSSPSNPPATPDPTTVGATQPSMTKPPIRCEPRTLTSLFYQPLSIHGVGKGKKTKKHHKTHQHITPAHAHLIPSTRQTPRKSVLLLVG